MAQPLLDFLTGSARAALPFFRQGVRLGLGANDILVMVSERIGGIRRQVGLDIIAALRNRIEPERLARLQGELTPFADEMHTELEYHIRSNYQYVIQSKVSTTLAEDYLTVSSAVPLSPSTIRILGTELFNTESYHALEEGQLLSPEQIAIVELNKNPPPTT